MIRRRTKVPIRGRCYGSPGPTIASPARSCEVVWTRTGLCILTVCGKSPPAAPGLPTALGRRTPQPPRAAHRLHEALLLGHLSEKKRTNNNGETARRRKREWLPMRRKYTYGERKRLTKSDYPSGVDVEYYYDGNSVPEKGLRVSVLKRSEESSR